ncbi:MAG TPA: DUF2797 domain-containing protein [Flavobacteriales bacterium]|nr:DUF2797 domain-containing protein [Flavobacteriales bacterium]|tara:strand:+ start:18783 stop:19598 length:816 start_codon:yes stop_codon:yes gene_type:complete
MKWTGNIRKMRTELSEEVQYTLPLYDVIEPLEMVSMNQFIGQEISLQFENEINCVVTGKRIKKAYGDGMSYDAFMSSPMASPSIIRPELSRIHEGIALRDKEWEEKHHLTPHLVYLSLTSEVKVGVTRETNIPYRWIDQGAVEAIVLAEVPYRQLAGAIEVALKEYRSDKTNWRKMLKNEYEPTDLLDHKDELIEYLDEDLQQFISDNDEITKIKYPVMSYPIKVTSMKLDKIPLIEKKLKGIKGQYLIFSDDTVFNMRSHSGYKVTLEAS